MSGQGPSKANFRRPFVAALTALSFGVAFQPGAAAQEVTGQARDSVARIDDRAHVEVSSANWMDAHVYLVRDGMVTSLGFVPGPGTTTFALPSFAIVPSSNLQLMVLPIGSRESYMSPYFNVDPGDLVKLQVENNLALSNLVLAPRGS